MGKRKLMVTGILFVVVLYGLNRLEAVNSFVQHVKQHTDQVVLSDPFQVSLPSVAAAEWQQGWKQDEREKLLDKIKQEAAKRNEAPIDAKLDPIWKAVPGYNGIEIDIERTLLVAEQQLFREPIPFVTKQLKPHITLDDLGAQPIYKGNPKKPMVALMINVAWGNEYLPNMLSVLEKEGVHATFFLDGSWLKNNVDTAKTIMSYGHEMSNHAYSHKDMSKLGKQQAISEISKTQQLLEKELGVSNKLFAPPSGDFNQETVKTAYELGLRTILWTIDTIDWKKPSSASIVQKITTRVEPGSLILMHPTESSSGALEGMIKGIKSKGLRLGTVSEVISPDRVPEFESTGRF